MEMIWGNDYLQLLEEYTPTTVICWNKLLRVAPSGEAPQIDRLLPIVQNHLEKSPECQSNVPFPANSLVI